MPADADLSPAQASAKLRYRLGSDLLGHSVGQALKVMAKDATFTDRDSLVDYLRSGPTVTMACAPTPRSTWRKHRITLTQDGSLELHHHVGVDLDGEQVMGALADHLPACLAAAIVVPDRSTSPDWYRAGRQSIDSRLRALHAAVAWAQDPSTDWTALKASKLVHMAVSPKVLAQWERTGFTRAQATPFWDAMVPIEAALPWLAAGDTTKRTARLAASGALPDADQPWLDAGFNKSSFMAWRQSSPLEPAEAYEWARRGFGVSDFNAITGTNRYRAPSGVTQDVAFTWADAGIRGTHVTAWHAATGGNLDEALPWSATGLPASDLQFVQNPQVAYRNRQGGWSYRAADAGLGLRRVQEWADAGFPISHNVRTLLAVDQHGLSPLQFAVAAGNRNVSGRDLHPFLEKLLGEIPVLH